MGCCSTRCPSTLQPLFSYEDARRTVPAFFFIALTLRTPACTHAHSAGFSLTLKHSSVDKEVVSSPSFSDRFHMPFQDNATDTQHDSAHTYESSLGSATPVRTPSDTARSTFGYQAGLPPSTSYASGVAVEFWASLRPWCGYFQHIELSLSGSRAALGRSRAQVRDAGRVLFALGLALPTGVVGWLFSARSSS